MVNNVFSERWLFFLLVVMVVVVMGLVAEVRGVGGSYPRAMERRTESLRTSFVLASTPSAPSPVSTPTTGASRSRVFHVTDYGADPTGKSDATEPIKRAITDAFAQPSDRILMRGITDLGGVEVHLDGGSYLVSSPIQLPSPGGGNVKIHGGSLHASDEFPTDGYLIELRSSSPSSSGDYEYITLRDLLLDANYRGGGVAVINSLRTTIDNLYITHFTTDGVYVKDGHETYVRNTYVGQHITAGGDPGEKDFSGTGINLSGNDNAVTDVVIFSAGVGVLVAGQANTLTNVHCYNKAAGWGGTGIYLKLPGLTQTRIVNCYMDYTGIVAEDPVQLHVSGSFFLGDAYVKLKSVNGVMSGVTIVDNMFSGGEAGVEIVQLDGKFTTVEDVVVDRNNARGMALKSTVARGSASGNGTAWAVDFSSVLLFPDRIDHVQYTLRVEDTAAAFVGHAVRNVTGNRVVVVADKPVAASVHVAVDQGVWGNA